LQEVTASFLRRFKVQIGAIQQTQRLQCRRYASTDAASTQEALDLEETGFTSSDPASEEAAKYDPLRRSRSYSGKLPSSRYVRLPTAHPAIQLTPRKIQVPATQVLSRASPSTSTTQALRSLLPRIHTRTLHPSSSRADLRFHPRTRSHDHGLHPLSTRLRRTDQG